jgi:chemotaxis protein methyltransferase CheR
VTDTGDIRPMSAGEFEQIRRLAYEQFGLDLHAGKEQLVATRLGKKIRELRFRSFHQYYRYVVEDRTGEALVALIDALTTNHTSFFREAAHFDFLRRKLLPGLRRRETIGIWSAGCSSGEEPYSILFSLVEELGEAVLSRVRLLATDISTRVLAEAERAIYPAERFEGTPEPRLRRFLLRSGRGDRYWYCVRPELRMAVEFRRLNLMRPFAYLGVFPLIFCRNVMIYFDRAVQQDLTNRLAGCLEPGGYLFIGHSESLNGIGHPLEYVCPGIYRKPVASLARSGKGRP